MYKLSRTTKDHYVFYDAEGNKFSVGIEVGTAEQAKDLLENPPLPDVAGIAPPNLDFELGVSESDQKNFAADLIGFQVKLRRNSAKGADKVKVADKHGTLHEITLDVYFEALDFYHTALRSAWLAGKGG